MKIIKLRLLNVVLTFLMLFSSLALLSYAWFSNPPRIFDQDIMGQARNSYFASGTGTEELPYIISKPLHFFNLAYLQNSGYFGTQQYYFKVANKTTGNPITIDFAATGVLPLFRTIKPIGTSQEKFIGIFDGNSSTLANFYVDGTGRQDIGVFGYIGATGSVTNLFLDSVTIYSNPSSSDSTATYHFHNDYRINVATGYIVGHLAEDAILANVFVMSPKISSLSNTAPNRSQYGLIGYNALDTGVIIGGPSSSYDFNFDATSAYLQLTWALSTWGTWYINGSGTLKLSDALKTSPATSQKLKLVTGYSLSTLKISQTANDPNAVYLYDMMVLNNHRIGSEADGYYKRENLNIIGEILWTEVTPNVLYYFNINANVSILTPAISSVFNPKNYAQTVVLYVRPSPDPNDLGLLTSTVQGGGSLSFYVGTTPGQAISVQTAGLDGVPYTLPVSKSFCMIDIDDETGVMTVVDSNPDYYIFLLGLSNGSSNIKQLDFSYLPAVFNAGSLGSVSNIDFINDETDVTDENGIIQTAAYTYSYFNFGYELTGEHTIEITTTRLSNDTFKIVFTSVVTGTSFIPWDVLNTENYYLEIYRGTTLIYSGTHDHIEIVITSTGVTATGDNFG